MEQKQQRFDFDTIVVGAGIVGSGCAYKIAKSGRKTLLIEQFPIGHAHGSSHGASRIIRCTHSDPVFLPFALDAYKEWDELGQIVGSRHSPLYIKNGLLTMDVDWAQTQLRANVLRRFGVRHEIMRGGEAIHQRFPHLTNYDENWTAVYEPDGGTLLAENCLNAIQEQFVAQGNLATLKANEKVLNILPRAIGQRGERPPPHPDEHPLPMPSITFVEVITDKGKYTAENVIVAAGCWLPSVVPNLPLKAVGHIIGVYFWRIKSRPELFRPLGNVGGGGSPNLVISDELGQELFGLPGTDYPDTMKFAIHLGMPVEDLDKMVKEKVLPEWMESIPRAHLAAHFPDLDSSMPLVKSTCVYTNTDDLSFIVDRHPQHPNIFIAGGFSGTGFKFALTIGRIMAKWVNGQREEEFDMGPFRIDRKIKQSHQRARL